MADQRSACLEEVVEGLKQPALRGLGCPAFGLDALANVAVEEVDGLPRRAVDARGVVPVPGHPAPSPWRVQAALALVEADRIHGHAGGPGQLFDPILHEYLL